MTHQISQRLHKEVLGVHKGVLVYLNTHRLCKKLGPLETPQLVLPPVILNDESSIVTASTID